MKVGGFRYVLEVAVVHKWQTRLSTDDLGLLTKMFDQQPTTFPIRIMDRSTGAVLAKRGDYEAV